MLRNFACGGRRFAFYVCRRPHDQKNAALSAPKPSSTICKIIQNFGTSHPSALLLFMKIINEWLLVKEGCISNGLYLLYGIHLCGASFFPVGFFLFLHIEVVLLRCDSFEMCYSRIAFARIIFRSFNLLWVLIIQRSWDSVSVSTSWCLVASGKLYLLKMYLEYFSIRKKSVLCFCFYLFDHLKDNEANKPENKKA